MSILKSLRVYLAGPVENSANPYKWRQDITVFLKKMGVIVYDPLVKPEWFPQNCHNDPASYKSIINDEQSTQQQVGDVFSAANYLRKACLKMVTSSDFVICYLPKTFTAGTFEEIYEAGRLNKPVLFCMPDGIITTWVLPIFSDQSNFKNTYFKSWYDMEKYLTLIDCGGVAVDKLMWLPSFY
jgi:nucleoside 2-deoxyribosyltransferase